MDSITELYDVAQALTALETASNFSETVQNDVTRQGMVRGHGYIQGLLARRVQKIAEQLDNNECPTSKGGAA